MMTTALALLACLVPVQDDRPAAIRDLAGRLSKEGLSGKLAEAAAADWGVQAIEEKIDFLLAGETAPLERDPMGRWLEAHFSRTPAGDFVLIPEKKAALAKLQARAGRAAAGMAGFFARCDGMTARLGTEGLAARARDWWSRPDYRVAFFHRHPAELREHSAEELLEAQLRDRMPSLAARLEAAKGYEKAYLQEASKVAEAGARAALSRDEAILFLVGRMLRQQEEGSPIQIGGIREGDPDGGRAPSLSFNLDLVELLPDVEAGLKLAAWIREHAAGREELGNAGIRLLLAEGIHAEQDRQRRQAAEIFDAVLSDCFVEEGAALRMKPGRFVDGEGKDSVEAFDTEHQAVIEEFEGALRQDFDRVAERCLEPELAALFENKAATYLLIEQRDRDVEGLLEGIRRGGLDLFAKTYLREEGGGLTVRPERAARVEALLKRAEEIRKQAEADK